MIFIARLLSIKEKVMQINSLKGVWGYFLCDNMGKILEREIPIVFMKHLAMMGKEVTQVIGLLENLSRSPGNLELLFEDGSVMIMSPKNLNLVVFCDPNVDIPMLRSKMKVVISEIQGNSKVQDLLKKGEWRRRRLLQKEYLNQEYREILDQLVPEDMDSSTAT